MARASRVLCEYLALVGVPIAAILVALHLGTSVAAPPHVAGRWVVTAVNRGTVAGECLATASSHGQVVMRVRQSGRYVSVRLLGWSGAAANGQIADSQLAIAWDDAAAPCLGALRLKARLVDEPDGRRVLVGSMDLPGCPECGHTAVRAERLPAADSLGLEGR